MFIHSSPMQASEWKLRTHKCSSKGKGIEKVVPSDSANVEADLELLILLPPAPQCCNHSVTGYAELGLNPELCVH